jgi:spore germination protein KC
MFSMTGCWDLTEIDEKAYVISIGLDKGTQNVLKMSLLIAIPKNIVSGGGGSSTDSSEKKDGGSGKGKESSELVVVEVPTIPSGINMANAFISRRVSLTHLKAVVFSEELSKEGVGRFLDYFNRDREVRGTSNVIVAKGGSDKFLRSLKPVLETNPAKYIELMAHANLYTAAIAKTTIGDFIRDVQSYDEQPIAVLGGVNKQALQEEEPIPYMKPIRKEADASNPNEGDYIAGIIPRKGDADRELMGCAIFDGDKMVGEFSGVETVVMMLIRGDYQSNFSSFEDPLKKGYYVPIDLRVKKDPSIKVKRIGNRFDISVKLELYGYVMAIQSGIDYQEEKNMIILEKSVEETVTKLANRVIKRAQKEYKSDVFKFGHYARHTFWSEDDWKKANWKGAFSDADIKVETDFTISHMGMVRKNSQIISSNGKQEIRAD